jgi:hypothetical protein
LLRLSSLIGFPLLLATAVAGVVLMRESRRIGRLAFPSRTPSRQMRR